MVRRAQAVAVFGFCCELIAQAPRPAHAREHGEARDESAIIAIVLHSVGGPSCVHGSIQFEPIPPTADDAAFWVRYMKAAPVADAHFVVGRRGDVEPVIAVAEIANHVVGLNPISIGIELVNRGDGTEPFNETQIAKTIELVAMLRRRYPKIALRDIVRHSDVDRRTCMCGGLPYRRRQDPGAAFPFERILAALRLPGETADEPTSLPHLTGPAPDAACPVR